MKSNRCRIYKRPKNNFFIITLALNHIDIIYFGFKEAWTMINGIRVYFRLRCKDLFMKTLLLYESCL